MRLKVTYEIEACWHCPFFNAGNSFCELSNKALRIEYVDVISKQCPWREGPTRDNEIVEWESVE